MNMDEVNTFKLEDENIASDLVFIGAILVRSTNKDEIRAAVNTKGFQRTITYLNDLNSKYKTDDKLEGQGGRDECLLLSSSIRRMRRLWALC